MDVGWLWILRFRVAGELADIDSALRSEALPLLQDAPGVADTFAARRSSERDWDHVVAATVLDCTVAAAVDARLGGWLCARWPGDVGQLMTRISPLTMSMRLANAEPARILRIFEGEVREGALERYVDAARQGALDGAARGQGPAALFLASDSPTLFTTLSLWACWADLEAATGGDVRRPLGIQQYDGVIGGQAIQYELITDPVLGPVRGAGEA